jgi:hypothetical protein
MIISHYFLKERARMPKARCIVERSKKSMLPPGTTRGKKKKQGCYALLTLSIYLIFHLLQSF